MIAKEKRLHIQTSRYPRSFCVIQAEPFSLPNGVAYHARRLITFSLKYIVIEVRAAEGDGTHHLLLNVSK